VPFRLVPGVGDPASSRIRCDAVEDHLEVPVTVIDSVVKGLRYPWRKGYAVLFQKYYLPLEARKILAKAKAKGVKVIFDLSDAEWEKPGREEPLVKMVKAADACTCSTPYLANWMEANGAKSVTVIPDRFDLRDFPETKEHTPVAPPTVVWVGNHVTRKALEDNLSFLAQVNQHFPFTLRVICDKPLPDFPGLSIENVAWSPDTENEDILAGDIMFNPRVASPYNLGKSPNKSHRAWLLGLPVLDYQYVGDWKERLEHLLLHWRDRRIEGWANREKAEAELDVRQSAAQLTQVLSAL